MLHQPNQTGRHPESVPYPTSEASTPKVPLGKNISLQKDPGGETYYSYRSIELLEPSKVTSCATAPGGGGGGRGGESGGKGRMGGKKKILIQGAIFRSLRDTIDITIFTSQERAAPLRSTSERL